MNASSSSLTPSHCPLSTLSIAGRAGHAFTPHAMMQGFTCHSRGVELAASDPGRIHARVRSKRLHDVLLLVEDGRLVVACTCPARSLGLDVCKHAWAALLEVDRQDKLPDLRGTSGPLAIVAAPLSTIATSTNATTPSGDTRTAPAAHSTEAAAHTSPTTPSRAKKVASASSRRSKRR